MERCRQCARQSMLRYKVVRFSLHGIFPVAPALEKPFSVGAGKGFLLVASPAQLVDMDQLVHQELQGRPTLLDVASLEEDPVTKVIAATLPLLWNQFAGSVQLMLNLTRLKSR